MTIGEAIAAIKEGKMAKRLGWNGKEQYIMLATNVSFETQKHREPISAHHSTMGNNAIVFVGTFGIQVGWLASQADLLSEDWMILDG